MLLVTWVLSELLLAHTNAQSGPQSTCRSCQPSQSLSDVRIPQAMTLADFEDHVIGKDWSEVYYVTKRPLVWEPWYNYNLRYETLSPNTFLERVTADYLDLGGVSSPECVRVNVTLLLADTQQGQGGHTRASFYKAGHDIIQNIWSSCPEAYIWIFKCNDRAGNHCPITELELGFAVPYNGPLNHGPIKSLENIPWNAALTDLRQGTGLVFGTSEMYWAWTLGETTQCN